MKSKLTLIHDWDYLSGVSRLAESFVVLNEPERACRNIHLNIDFCVCPSLERDSIAE